MRWYRFLFAAVIVVAPYGTSGAQVQPRTPQSYSNYYVQQRQQSRSPARAVNPATYTYNRMYYHNPAVSPYSNLLRPSGAYTNNYFTYVKPEQQRRAQAAAQQRQLPTRSPTGVRAARAQASGGNLPGYYQNHWYGGWADRR